MRFNCENKVRLVFYAIFCMFFHCGIVVAQDTIKYKNCYDFFEKIDKLTPLPKKKYDKHRAVRRRKTIPQEICENIANSDTVFIVLGKGVDFIDGSYTEFVMGSQDCYYKGLLYSETELQIGKNINLYKELIGRIKGRDYKQTLSEIAIDKFAYEAELLVILTHLEPNKFVYSIFSVYEDLINKENLYIIKHSSQAYKTFLRSL